MFSEKRIDAEPRLLTCVFEVVAIADIFYRTVKWLFYARVKAQFRPIKTGKDAPNRHQQLTLNPKVKYTLWASSGQPPPNIPQ